jgi:hypothetical protein
MKISRKWIIVSIYTAGIFAVAPFLPQLIKAASSRWSSSGVKYFVLGVEIAIALLILILAIRFLIYRRKKAVIFFSSVGSIFLLSFLIYQFIPNPYEFTHLPEYAALSMLIVWAVGKEKHRIAGTPEKKKLKSTIFKNSYFLSGVITSSIGTIDEIYQYFLPNRYFTWYDILLNILGAILGLFIFWGIKR